MSDELGLRKLVVWLTTAQCTDYLNRWAAVVNGLTPQVVSMAGRLTAEGYKGYAHISDAAAWKAIAPEDQEEIREGMAADFEDSSMRDELLSFHRAAVELRNDPAVLSCFKSGRDVPRIPWITETSRAMHCYLRDTGDGPGGSPRRHTSPARAWRGLSGRLA